MHRLLRDTCLFILVFSGAVRMAAAQAPPDPLLAAVPPQARAVILLDLRPDTESAKVLSEAQPRVQAALIRSLFFLGLQQALSAVAPGVDVETEALPLLTRRVAICMLPAAGRKDEGVVLLELTDAADAAAGFERVMQIGLKAGTLTPGEPMAGAPVWLGAKGLKGVAITRRGQVVVFGSDKEQVAVVAGRAETPGVAAAPAVQALAAGAPGVVRLGAAFPPATPGQPGLPGLSGLAAALRFHPGGILVEAVAPVTANGNQGPWSALAMLKPTFGESIAGIPESATAVLVLARPSVLLQAFGIPIVDALAGGFVGPDPLKPMGQAAAPLLSDVLAQEVALALLPGAEKPSWLAVFTSARPDALRANVERVLQANPGGNAMAWLPAPLGNDPAWSVRLTPKPGASPIELQIGLVEARVLVAGDRNALEAGAAVLRRQAKSAAAAAWYADATRDLGTNPVVKAAGNLPALGQWLATFAAGKAGLSSRYASRAAQALMVPFGTVGAGLRVEGTAAHGTLQVGVDYAKLNALGGALPMAGAVALGLAPLARTIGEARGSAHTSACASNLKQLSLAAIMYERDWGKLPPAEGWAQQLEPYLKNAAILRCPADEAPHPSSYAFNSALAGLPLAQVKNPASVVLFYETTATQASPAGTGAGLPNPPRHEGRAIFAFADGHVEVAPAAQPGWFNNPGAP